MKIKLTRKVTEVKSSKSKYVLLLASVQEDNSEPVLCNVLLKKKYIPELVEQLTEIYTKGDKE